MTFYLTPTLTPHRNQVRQVIELSGGTVAGTRRRSVKELRALYLNSSTGARNPGPFSYVVITSEDDLYMVEDLLCARVPVYTVDFVFVSVIRNAMDFDVSKYLVAA